MKAAERLIYLTGRSLLGLYFILPGIMKVTGFSGTAEYMAAHGMILVPIFLVLTIIIQIGGGCCLAIGYRVKEVAFVLAGLVLVISLVMHNFWSLEEGVQKGHEMQNFIKNMAIMAGLMVLAGGVTKSESSTSE